MRTKQRLQAVVLLTAMFLVLAAPGALSAKQKGSLKKAMKGFHRNGRPFIHLQERIDQLEARLSGYEAASAALKNEVTAVRQEIFDIQTRIVHMQSTIESQMEALSGNVAQNTARVEAVRSEIAQLQSLLYDKIAELLGKVEQVETELGGSIVVLQEQNMEYQNAIDQWEAETAQLRDTLAGSIDRLNSLEDQVDLNSRLIVQLQECLNIQNTINEIQGEINAAGAQIQENALRIADLEKRMAAMPVGTHELAMGDGVSEITVSSTTDRYWLFIGWAQLACNYASAGYAEIRLYIDDSVADSVAQLGSGAGKRTLSMSHLELLPQGDHTARLGLYTTVADGQDYAVVQKGKIIAIAF